VHRPRRRAALTREHATTGPERLPQAWVPRVTNLACAALALLFLVPLFTHLGGRPVSVQVMLVVVSVPFVLVVVLCLASALRPGSLGRLLRRARSRRT
jgi:peptidoglycan/LPS O-acetylase OafA/YrhL